MIFHLYNYIYVHIKNVCLLQPQEKKKSYKEIREEQLKKEAEEKAAKEAAEVSSVLVAVDIH